MKSSQTFAQISNTRPPATFISKSLTSLLLEYDWKQVKKKLRYI